MFTEILSDTSGQAALSRFATTNTWNAQQIFKASGTQSPAAIFQATGTTSTSALVDANAIVQFQGTEAVASHVLYDAAAAPTHVYFRRTNGTYATRTAIANADILGSLQWQGYGTSTYGTTVQAQIRAVANQAFTDAAKGTDLVFLTTASGAAVTATALTLNASLATFAGSIQGTGNATATAGIIARANGTISANPASFGGGNTAFHSIGAQAVSTYNMFDSCAGSNQITMRRRNGTYSAQTAIANNDVLGQIDVSGWDTVTFRQNAQIQMYAVETFTSTANGTAMSFATTTAGTTTLTTRLTLHTTANFTVPVISTGNLRIASPTVPAAANSAGTAGDIAWASGFLYVCVATNTWQRVAIATWP